MRDRLLERLELANGADDQVAAGDDQPRGVDQLGVEGAGDREVVGADLQAALWLAFRKVLNRASVKDATHE